MRLEAQDSSLRVMGDASGPPYISREHDHSGGTSPQEKKESSNFFKPMLAASGTGHAPLWASLPDPPGV